MLQRKWKRFASIWCQILLCWQTFVCLQKFWAACATTTTAARKRKTGRTKVRTYHLCGRMNVVILSVFSFCKCYDDLHKLFDARKKQLIYPTKTECWTFSKFLHWLFTVAGYTHNPYNGVICNDIILATGVFSSKELWRLSKCKYTCSCCFTIKSTGILSRIVAKCLDRLSRFLETWNAALHLFYIRSCLKIRSRHKRLFIFKTGPTGCSY